MCTDDGSGTQEPQTGGDADHDPARITAVGGQYEAELGEYRGSQGHHHVRPQTCGLVPAFPLQTHGRPEDGRDQQCEYVARHGFGVGNVRRFGEPYAEEASAADVSLWLTVFQSMLEKNASMYLGRSAGV